MQASIHTPERLAHESMGDYRLRQEASHRAATMGRLLHAGYRSRTPWTNPQRNAERAMCRAWGARQYRLQVKASRRAKRLIREADAIAARAQ